jgi:hypothetical protein
MFNRATLKFILEDPTKIKYKIDKLLITIKLIRILELKLIRITF